MKNFFKKPSIPLLLTAILTSTSSYAQQFRVVGQFYLTWGNPTGISISELNKSWGYDTNNYTTTTINKEELWTESPDLRIAPYNLTCPNGSTLSAVLLTIKAKAKTITWTPTYSVASIQISVRHPWNEEPTNEVVHAYTEKLANNPKQTTQDLNISTVPIAVQDGKFEIYSNITYGPYTIVNRVVYITGYWC